MSFLVHIQRQLEDLRRQVDLIRHGLVRLGTVQLVDADAGTVVVEYAAEEGEPTAKSLPMPWMQRSTEHRPPVVGDHALVLDPSMGNGGGVAVCGWPSEARPAAGGGGELDVIHRDRESPNGDVYDPADGTRTITLDTLLVHAADATIEADVVTVDSPDILLGPNPTDYPALTQLVMANFNTLKSAISAAAVTPMDGGAAFKAALVAALASWPSNVAAANVRVK
jgi:phage baseplate assembly protein gpV